MNDYDKVLYNSLIERLCRILIMHARNKIAKKQLFYDGLYYSVKMIRAAYHNLVDKLCTLADFKFKDPADLAESAITEAWAIVDSLYRLRKLLEDTPGLKQKSPELQLFYRKTKCLKDLRDSIQHLDEYIEKYVSNKIPAWGRVSWVYPTSPQSYKACMINLGDVQPDWKLMPSRMGEKMRTPVDFITITAENTVCLTHMIDALEQLMPWLNNQLNNTFNRKHQLVIVGFGIDTHYNIY